MSEDIFSKFDSEFDTQALAADVAAAQAGRGGKYEKPPYGKYEVKIEYLGLGESKLTQKPMAKVTFEIVAGQLKGRKIYMNQLVDVGFKIHLFNEFMRSLKTSIPVNGFTTYRNLNQTTIAVKAKCDELKLTFQLDYSKDKKDFDVFTIEEVFENDDIPF